jgi:hypothetical protein
MAVDYFKRTCPAEKESAFRENAAQVGNFLAAWEISDLWIRTEVAYDDDLVHTTSQYCTLSILVRLKAPR